MLREMIEAMIKDSLLGSKEIDEKIIVPTASQDNTVDTDTNNYVHHHNF